MSEIIKTEAVILSKMNYGDTSNILSVYTKDYGKLSVIIKGNDEKDAIKAGKSLET